LGTLAVDKQSVVTDSSPMIASVLRSEQISKSFEKGGKVIDVLQNVTFSVKKGSFTSIIGPSGCGKTTLLRILDGLIKPDSGTVYFDAKPVTSPPTKIGFVFQQFNLLPWRTVLGNIEFGLKIRGVEENKRLQIAARYIDLMGLRGFENHYPHEISGGMQQRVGIARALSIEPDLLLMDEPFASVDMQTREILQKELLRIVKGQLPKTTLFVTHNIDEAIFLSDEIILLEARPGKVRETIQVTLPPERWKYDPRSNPEYTRIRNHIWSFLEDEIKTKELLKYTE
jgi:NitT/TauT family transport system ATP-binding protein